MSLKKTPQRSDVKSVLFFLGIIVKKKNLFVFLYLFFYNFAKRNIFTLLFDSIDVKNRPWTKRT